jgi:GTP1/Obg family GTP-binding protein
MSIKMNENKNDALQDSELGFLVSSTLHKLEHISDHHVTERRKGFRITNIMVIIVSILLFLIATINMYYLYYFYDDTIRIIKTTHSLDNTVLKITRSMKNMNENMAKFNKHMDSMPAVYENMASMSHLLPKMNSSMLSIKTDMQNMNHVMVFVNRDIQLIDFHLYSMTGKVRHIGGNMNQLAKPMGMFNGILP